MDIKVDERFLNCVFFVCIEGTDDRGEFVRKPVGTGFKVGVPGHPGSSFVYFVTARHLIEEPDVETIWLRFNREDGTAFDHRTHKDDWTVSATDDVAAIRADVPSLLHERVDPTRVHLSSFVDADGRYRTDDLVGGAVVDGSEIHEISDGIPVVVGSGVVIVGLFSQHYGTRGNVPLARFGHIAALASEPVRMRRFAGIGSFEAPAYLVESLSWGGISGSPVFFTAPMLDGVEYAGVWIPTPAYKIGLIGLISGHFGIQQRLSTTGDVILENEGSIEAEMNSGIAVVTPSSAIKGLLMEPAFVEERERLMGTPGGAHSP